MAEAVDATVNQSRSITDLFSYGLERYIDNRLPESGGSSGQTVIRTGDGAPNQPIKVAGTGPQTIGGVDNRLVIGAGLFLAGVVVVMMLRK